MNSRAARIRSTRNKPRSVTVFFATRGSVGPPLFCRRFGSTRMGELIHTSHIRLEKIKGPIRHAYIENCKEPVRYGVHGAIKKFYGDEREEEVPANLDHMLADLLG